MPDVRFDSHTLTPGQLRSKKLNRKFSRSEFIDSITRMEWKIAIFVEFFLPVFELLFSILAWSLLLFTCALVQPLARVSHLFSPSSSLSLSPSVFRKAESYYALRVSAIDHRLGLGRGKGTMWCGLFCVCVCQERSCVGVVSRFLGSLSPVKNACWAALG